MSRTDTDSPEVRLVKHALEKLRARGGLTAARLLASRNGDAAALLELDAVGRYAEVHNVDRSRAAMELVKACVSNDLEGSDRVVADAILGLGAFADTYASHNVPSQAISALSTGLLGHRRQTLLSRWSQLHQALDLPPTSVPSDRVLRRDIEPRVLASLARHLVRRRGHSSNVGTAATSTAADESPLSEPATSSRRVVVIGGAVMDTKYRMKALPQVDMATEARSLNLAPGGKGLYQALAATRLGFKTSLIAAVARDSHGDEIVEFLQAEGVDTSLLKRVDDAVTPLTTVLELELGESAAVFCRDTSVRLEPSDIESVSDWISACGVILMTFEPPKETLEAALRVVSQRGEKKPIVVVTPGQPYDTTISGQSLSAIDYLVARKQELGQYQPADGGPLEVDDVAQVLMTQGVETLCVTDSRGCNVYSRSREPFPVPTFPSSYREAAVARDAFCAALAARVLENDRKFSAEVALWATAAMAAATADHLMPNPMPDRRRIEQILDSSPFSVNLRSEAGSS